MKLTVQDKRSAMPCACTVCDIVDAIQVLLALFTVHVLPLCSDNLDGVVAEENLAGWTKQKRQDGNFYSAPTPCNPPF